MAAVQLAILAPAADELSPSSPSSIQHFCRVASSHGVQASLIGKTDYGRLGEFDALFIRQITSVDGIAHRFALRAQRLGLPVIDDPLSIVRGSSKTIQHRLLSAQRIPTPRSLILGRVDDVREAVEQLGLPLVLKIPDGSFSIGVEKAEALEQCRQIAATMLRQHREIIAQEYLPTPFDWRLCILDGAPLFACKYHVAPGHWQVNAHDGEGSVVPGPTEPVPLHLVDGKLISLATAAGRCLGRGLYGIDLKEGASGPVVVEVNDNPDMDSDVETCANPEAWDRLVAWFVTAVWSSALRSSVSKQLEQELCCEPDLDARESLAG
jgi:glutathione synthase/RimK-type ligase-like ATP-grasp enzyme